jgi:hypothetical protein
LDDAQIAVKVVPEMENQNEDKACAQCDTPIRTSHD